jgi:hypothetical protein
LRRADPYAARADALLRLRRADPDAARAQTRAFVRSITLSISDHSYHPRRNSPARSAGNQERDEMKRFVVAVLLLSGVGGSVFGAGDVLQQLGYRKDDAARDAVFAVSVGQFGIDDGAKKKLRAASPEMRAALVEQGLVWLKAYTQTPQFEQAYQEHRNDYKPEAPGTEGSAEDIASAREYYNEQLAEWKQNYSATGREMVKRRLREFLQESANVDFNAKLVRRDNKMRFANEQYEDETSDEWKFCYRAGRLPVEKARAFAKTWLAEMK